MRGRVKIINCLNAPNCIVGPSTMWMNASLWMGKIKVTNNDMNLSDSSSGDFTSKVNCNWLNVNTLKCEIRRCSVCYWQHYIARDSRVQMSTALSGTLSGTAESSFDSRDLCRFFPFKVYLQFTGHKQKKAIIYNCLWLMCLRCFTWF